MADYTSESMWAGLDPQRREAFQRAVTETSAGSKLVQNLTNRIIQQLSLRAYGLLGVLDVRPGQGQQAIINRRTENSTSNAQWLMDVTDPSDLPGEYSQSTFTYRSLVARAAVTRKIRATGRSYIDVLAEEMTKKLEDFNDELDTGLLLGDPNSDISTGVTMEVEGFLTACNTYNSGSQVVSNLLSTTILTTVGDTITLKNVDKAIDLVKGGGNRSDLIIVGSYAGIRALNAALAGRQVFNDTVEVAAGFRVRTYDGIPVIPDTNMTDTMSFITDGMAANKVVKTLSGVSGASSTALLVINKRMNWIEELTPTTVMPLARDSSQSEKFDIFWDGAAVVANPLASSILYGIKTT